MLSHAFFPRAYLSTSVIERSTINMIRICSPADGTAHVFFAYYGGGEPPTKRANAHTRHISALTHWSNKSTERLLLNYDSYLLPLIYGLFTLG